MNINLMAPINRLGYGVVGSYTLKSLMQLGHNVSLFVIGNAELTNPQDGYLIQKAVNNQHIFDNNAPCIKIWHQFAMAERIGKGKMYGFPIFELDKFNPLEKRNLKSVNEVFVTSKWAQRVVLNNIIEIGEHEIHVVPLGVDSTIFNKNIQSAVEVLNPDEAKQKSTTCNFFNAGKWEVRKGHDILIECFKRVFSVDDNVHLFMLSHNPFYSTEENQKWENLYKYNELGEKVTILQPVNTHQDVAQVMSQMDCGVFPSRAEGWNLELLEMMALGKPVIATNYSAHTEFCNNDNCTLIDIDETQLAHDGRWFTGQGNWAKLGPKQLDKLCEAMYNTYVQWKKNNLGLDVYGISIAEQCSWKNTAQHIESVLV